MISATVDTAGYGQAPVLEAIDFVTDNTGLYLLLGRNGAGKTTMLKALMGLLPSFSGRVDIGGVDPTAVPLEILASRVSYMPQEGGVFDGLTVDENLRLTSDATALERCLEVFPALDDRRSQKAGTLSGGERKMLGLCRALSRATPVVLLDEPTEGVWYELVTSAAVLIGEMSESRCIVLVEQAALSMFRKVSRVSVIANGGIALSGDLASVANDERLESLLAL